MELNRASVINFATQAIEERGEEYVNPLYGYLMEEGPHGGAAIPMDEFASALNCHEKDGDMCRYVDPQGQPSCIVGTVLAAAGVPVNVLQGLEGIAAREVLKNDSVQEYVQATSEAVRALVELQTAQDSSVAWKFALDGYLNNFPSSRIISMWDEQQKSV